MENNRNNLINKYYPVVSYENAYAQKVEILKINKEKTGVYRWVHKESGKSYVGSSINLANRFINYYNLSYLKRSESNSIIYKALIKYGYSNFKLDILEYCNPNILILREQYFIDLLMPDYNILKKAGSSLGFKHSNETKAQMSINSLGLNNPLYGKKRSDKVRAKISESHRLRLTVNLEAKVIRADTRLKLSSRCSGINVKVIDKSNKLVNQFTSIASTAKHFNVDRSIIKRIFHTGIQYNDFIFKFEVKDNRVWVYNNNHKLIKILNDVLKASISCNIPYTTLSRYIKSGKLYKNKFYFYNINSKNNPYFYK